MKNVHLVIPDLFLTKDFAAEVCDGLSVPALEKLLARGRGEILESVPLENLLCEMFDVPSRADARQSDAPRADAPVAPISAAFDGLGEGCWLRADPVHLRLQREQMLLLPNLEIGADEAGQMCVSLNQHFAGQGMEFFAPHPLRWYVRFGVLPDIETVPLSQASGHNVHGLLPKGAEALRWHQVFNEIQMLLFAHPLNEAREARGELPINSVWFWGGGDSALLPQKKYQSVYSDEVLAEMFAAAADIPFAGWPAQWRDEENIAGQLLVWTGLRSALQRGDLAAWRKALQDFETGYAQPLWQALRSGKIAQLRLDILGGESFRRASLTRRDAWAFWRRSKRLAEYSLV